MNFLSRCLKLTPLLLGGLLTACADPNQGPETPPPFYTNRNLYHTSVAIKAPSADNPDRVIAASVSRSSNSGPYSGYPAGVGLRFSQVKHLGTSVVFLSPLDRGLTEAFANANSENVSPDLIFEMGKQFARQTVCQGGRVTRNSYGRRYKPEPGMQLGQPIPAGAVGTPLPAVEKQILGWKVNLWCR